VLAADGEQALQEFRSHRDHIDLALLDVVLPKLSGPEVYARICKEKPNLPVVFATGYSPDIALLQKVQQQGLFVLQKPYSPRDLARTVPGNTRPASPFESSQIIRLTPLPNV
jgi:CheY-like chemotaxis protein